MSRLAKYIQAWLPVVFCIALLTASCTTVGPEYVPAKAPLADAWQMSPASLKATEHELIDWWEVFNDPVLDHLVDLAHQQNLTLELAGLRVLESRAQLGIATGARFPQQQAASGGVNRVSPSENAGQGKTSFNQYDLGLGLSWELDFWGRYRRGIESADASFSWPFLNYGRIRNNIRVQDARLQQALVNYQDIVLKAARETDDAIVSLAGTQEQESILANSVEAARRSSELSVLRYQEGFSGYQRVLDSQQALFRQQNSYVQNRGLSARNVVAIYKALGGGWEVRQGKPYIDENTLSVMRARTNWGKLLDGPVTEKTGEDGIRSPD